MTAPIHTLPIPTPIPTALKKKRVLLVDASPTSRELRTEIMRKLGMEVDCAADITEARSWWRAALYNLVLMNTESELGRRDQFCADIRGATPPQQLAFLVGKPAYLADSPIADAAFAKDGDSVAQDEPTPAMPAENSADPRQRWGILEASRRISAVRSASIARSKAIKQKPAPPRDLETRESKRAATWSKLLPEIAKEEMQ